MAGADWSGLSRKLEDIVQAVAVIELLPHGGMSKAPGALVHTWRLEAAPHHAEGVRSTVYFAKRLDAQPHV
jgi:hypothetical protein